ncbi:MAG TPA: ATP-binding protein [Ktedonobacterales bacterium]|nr:ATP-binding protein [Ktedonobacterales bacterium]
MERLGDTLGNYPLRRRQPSNGNGPSEQLSLDHLLDETAAQGPRRAEESAARQPGNGARRKEGEQPCPFCHGAGYLSQDLPVDDPNFGKIVPCSCKEKELKQKRRLELGRLARLDSHWDQTFDTFDQSVPGVQEAYKMARAYADDPQGWLVLSGSVGCGKTHLAAAIANVCLERDSLVIFSTVPELLDHLRTAFAPSNEMPYHELFDRIREAYLLVLDDLGVEHSTAWATEKLFQIINYRYEYRMPTIITTNTDLKGLDMRIQSRLFDIGLVRRCHIKAADYRPRNVPAKQVRRS